MTDELSVTLRVDEPLRQTLRENEGALTVAQTYEIDCEQVAELANRELRGVKERIERLKKLKAGFIAPAQQILDNANALFNPALLALAEAEKTLKLGLANWTLEQARIAEEARRRAQEEDRRRRQEAEAQAAAARAKAEQEAAEQRRIAREADEARLKAEREGNAKAAARAAAEAAKATEKAAAVVENAEAKAGELVLAAESAAAPVVEAPRKVAGFSVRENWKFELAPDKSEAAALIAVVQAAAGARPDLLSLLKIDYSAGDKLAKAQKKMMSVPCFVAMNRPVSSSRAA